MLVLTIGQLVPQLFVEEFTIPFMNLYGCYFVTQLCFFAEFIGVCNFSWLLFHAVNNLFFTHKKRDPEERFRGTPSPRSPTASFVEEDPLDQDIAGVKGIRLGWFDQLSNILYLYLSYEQ